MGYEHYLWRPPELDLERWREWVGDVRQILANLPAQVPQTYYPFDGSPVTAQAPLILTGPIGDEGLPELSDSKVAFNGGGWVGMNGHLGRLWAESFWVERAIDPSHFAFDLTGDPFDLEAPYGPKPDSRGWYYESFKTNQRPYDLAVTASLIRLAHRFPEGVQVSSDGGPDDWQAGVDLCREVFGHAEPPFAGHAGPAPTAGPDRLNELLAKRDGGPLAPHEVGELRELLDRDLEPEQPAGSVDVPACSRTRRGALRDRRASPLPVARRAGPPERLPRRPRPRAGAAGPRHRALAPHVEHRRRRATQPAGPSLPRHQHVAAGRSGIRVAALADLEADSRARRPRVEGRALDAGRLLEADRGRRGRPAQGADRAPLQRLEPGAVPGHRAAR